MKVLNRLILGAALALMAAVSGFSQTATTETTLAAAVTTTQQNSITLTSATGVVAGRFIFVDRELMRVGATYVSGTTIPVVRAQKGLATPHISLAKVTIGISGSFIPAAGAATGGTTSGVMLEAQPYGPCSPTAQGYTITVHVPTGNRYQCVGDSFTIISGPGSNIKIVQCVGLTAAIVNVDSSCFLADRPYRVIGITEVHNTIEDTAASVQVVKDTSTDAPGAGTDLLATAFDLTSTTRVPVVGTLTSTTAALHLVAGNRLSWDASAATDTVTGMVITISLLPE
jgi:hypothetical protein